jgi:hypothetical protein
VEAPPPAEGAEPQLEENPAVVDEDSPPDSLRGKTAVGSIHPSARKGSSTNFVLRGFSEVGRAGGLKTTHLGDTLCVLAWHAGANLKDKRRLVGRSWLASTHQRKGGG